MQPYRVPTFEDLREMSNNQSNSLRIADIAIVPADKIALSEYRKEIEQTVTETQVDRTKS